MEPEHRPAPAAGQVVPGNRWDRFDVPEIGAFAPRLRVSVILPYFEAPDALELTLAGLAAQTYPPELTQVIVADDGSEPPLTLPPRHRGLDITVVHQEDRGFGLARARNTGAAAADGDLLVFLDCDMIPEPHHLEAHARWHHVCDHAVTLGFRQHVDVAGIGPDDVTAAAHAGALEPLFDGRPRTQPEWLERHMTRMAELTAAHDDLFRAVTGGNLGVQVALFVAVGGFDATFTQWGSEDTDIGHRLFLAGAVLVPERGAACWHQGDSRGLEPHERASLDQQRARISQTVPHPGFRRTVPGRSFTIPRLLVEVDAGTHPHATVTATIESLLANELHDLEVLLRIPDEHPEGEFLRRAWAGDPRVVERERDEHRWTPHRLSLPVGAAVSPHTLEAIVARLADLDDPVGVLQIGVPGAPDGLAVSTRALARARLLGAEDVARLAAELFGERRIDGHEVGVSWRPVRELPRVGRPRRDPPALTSRAGEATSTLAPWLLVDSPLGWLTRGAVADLLRDADTKLGEADARAEEAEHRAALARHELDRLRNRRAVRLATELAETAHGDVLGLPRRLRAATTPSPEEPPPEPPVRRKPRPDTRHAGAELEERGLLPPRPERVPPFPHLRVLHLGAAGRFVSLAAHTSVTPDGWEQQLRAGTDLVLIEPPADTTSWDPLYGDLARLLQAATELGIPSVRIGSAVLGRGPGEPTLELVEGVTPGRPQHDEAAITDGILSPSVDTSVFNPRGWRHQPPDAVLAVFARPPDAAGRDLLARFDPPVIVAHTADLAAPDTALGIPLTLGSPRQLQRTLTRTGVLLDHPSWRGDATESLRHWIAALACGTPIVLVTDGDADGDTFEHPDGTRMPVPPGVLLTEPDEAAESVHRLLIDPDLRERYGIAGRRWALREGGRETALRTILDHLDVPVPAPPRTTVLLATNRPEFLERGLDSVARQTQPGVDVSLVLHGSRFDGVDAPERDGLVTSVVRAPDHWLLGDCLNAALDHAGGELVAKMDDDDHYGPEHLRDLVTAWGYSGADLVGKRVEYVHLAERGVTLRRPTSRPERDRPHVGGPTILAARETLLRHRFLRVPNRVDSTLYERLLADGCRIYRIHSRDLVLERHGQGHAWTMQDEQFLADAIEVRDGLALDLATSDPHGGT